MEKICIHKYKIKLLCSQESGADTKKRRVTWVWQAERDFCSSPSWLLTRHSAAVRREMSTMLSPAAPLCDKHMTLYGGFSGRVSASVKLLSRSGNSRMTKSCTCLSVRRTAAARWKEEKRVRGLHEKKKRGISMDGGRCCEIMLRMWPAQLQREWIAPCVTAWITQSSSEVR